MPRGLADQGGGAETLRAGRRRFRRELAIAMRERVLFLVGVERVGRFDYIDDFSNIKEKTGSFFLLVLSRSDHLTNLQSHQQGCHYGNMS